MLYLILLVQSRLVLLSFDALQYRPKRQSNCLWGWYSDLLTKQWLIQVLSNL